MLKATLTALLFVSSVAGAQTVAVGNLTSTQNGVTTTITVPVSVAVPASNLALLHVEASTSAGATTGQTLTTAWKTVALPNVVLDTASGWNPTTNTYTVPVSGTYLIVSNLRLADALSPGLTYGQGVHTAHTDGSFLLWNTTAGLHNGSINTRVAQLSAGQTIDLYASVEAGSAVAINSASLSIQQLQ